MVERVPSVGADRIELYTESYAQAFDSELQDAVLEKYRAAALRASQLDHQASMRVMIWILLTSVFNYPFHS